MKELINIILEMLKNRAAVLSRTNQRRIESLEKIYSELGGIVTLFPDKTPYSILRNVENAPNYHGNYDNTIHLLVVRIKDSQETIERYKKNNQIPPFEIETRISNWQFAQKELKENQRIYEKADRKYQDFISKNKGEIEILFTRNVKNALVVMNVALNNTFGIPGRVSQEKFANAKSYLLHNLRHDLGM